MTDQKAFSLPAKVVFQIILISILLVLPITVLLFVSYSYLSISLVRLTADHPFRIPLFTSFVGVLVSLIRRFRLKKRRGERKLVDILVNDFYFEDYATLSVISFVYGVVQGALLGGALGFSLVPLIDAFLKAVSMPLEYFLFGSLGSLILLILVRMFLEGYTILYRTAQDFGSYMREKTY